MSLLHTNLGFRAWGPQPWTPRQSESNGEEAQGSKTEPCPEDPRACRATRPVRHESHSQQEDMELNVPVGSLLTDTHFLCLYDSSVTSGVCVKITQEQALVQGPYEPGGAA